MKLKDERIKVMSEVLNGIKLLKMYSWEMSFMVGNFNLHQKDFIVCFLGKNNESSKRWNK